MGFKLLVSVCLVLIVLLLGTLAGATIYTDLRVSQASKTVSGKVDTFNHAVNNINDNLQSINSQLQTDRQGINLP